ncbi:MAG: M14 family zinc carboxypeptidase, partial [Acidobacteriota bacterium]
DVADASPDAVRAPGKTRIWIQGGIHSGEACGKEAMLIMLRELAQGAWPQWDDDLVLMIAPLYNADGNELVKIDNRGRQNGPIGGMGQRPNAQGYDLNRDHMKLDSPEARSLVTMMNRYDPHLGIDLHTTNGTQHAYYVTYSPPLNPNTPEQIDEMLRGDWLPTLTAAVKEKHGWDYFYYGNASGMGGGRGFGGRGGRGGAPPAGAAGRGGRAAAPSDQPQMPRWGTFDHRPRFNNNYIGLRNRFALLSEAYAYATFEDRVWGSYWFVEEALNYAAAHAAAMRDIVAAADAQSVVGQSLGVRFDTKQIAQPIEILMGETEQLLNPYSGQIILNRLDTVRTVTMRDGGTFEATESEVAPAVYFIPESEREAINKLTIHGVNMWTLDEEVTLPGERFAITSSTTAERTFQDHNERTLEGAWEAAELTLPAGTTVVEVAQPLGRLTFSLLEPRADTGFADWNVFDRSLEGAAYYPVTRAHAEGAAMLRR